MATRTRSSTRAALPEAATYLELLVTQDQFAAEVADLFSAHDLTSQQYNVLRILRGGDAGGLPCQVIGERMIQRVPDVTRLVDRLEAARLVERARTPEDRRVVLVRITAAGRNVLAALDAPVDALHKKQFASLAPAELAELQRLLQKARERR